MNITFQTDLLGIPVLAFLASGAGAYLGAYLKRKGEDRATKENLSNLNDQMALITATTKAIEDKISNETWDRQRRWELKKDLFLECSRLVGKAHSMLRKTIGCLQCARDAVEVQSQAAYADQAEEYSDLLGESLRELSGSGMLLLIVSGVDLVTSFLKVVDAFAKAADFLDVQNIAGVEESMEDLDIVIGMFHNSIRAELNIPLDPNSIALVSKVFQGDRMNENAG